ncbi:hypothetical protein CsSME_00021510 [Camellia sinensis var. sinensis]
MDKVKSAYYMKQGPMNFGGLAMIESLTNDADDSHAKPTGGCCQKKNESEKAGKHFSFNRSVVERALVETLSASLALSLRSWSDGIYCYESLAGGCVVSLLAKFYFRPQIQAVRVLSLLVGSVYFPFNCKGTCFRLHFCQLSPSLLNRAIGKPVAPSSRRELQNVSPAFLYVTKRALFPCTESWAKLPPSPEILLIKGSDKRVWYCPRPHEDATSRARTPRLWRAAPPVLFVSKQDTLSELVIPPTNPQARGEGECID